MPIPRHRTATGRPLAVRYAALLLLSGLFCGAALPTITFAQSAPAERSAQTSHAAHIAEASQRFRIPERWIRAVMQVESAGRTRAVSSAGAMGLMQIMPETWAELSARHRLGRDPFDPRANIFGGTAYLREMYDRFGSPGFLAAYNAGPERYQQHLDRGRALPRETRAYMARLLPMLGLALPESTATVAPPPPDWREAPLFIDRSQRKSAADRAQAESGSADGQVTSRVRPNDTNNAQHEPVFVDQSRGENSP
ncbi:lytic transglycosylase domain-containing protein [Oceaniovalibus sp. ACAM 378]|uniref:lytic transglycosylase domain-containing protein n=1 Tax=Oceaniovalibus sp. ACAM 378 TaxID=2599923 RepID=UPI0011D391E5|nr:lytic transglycosylase domain-containing protein [Oceaniovalibus sp. ACAM 378]TYB86088.1 lytic transglycosylase domain-containing protein [Oceaniovalibus sp. ACAM 378]